jgi:two-component system NtrC family sensor kinase
MKRRDKAGGKAVKTRRRKALMRRSALKATSRRSSSRTGRETNVERLSRELGEAFEQQAATANILNIISNSPTDTQPVFDAIVQSGLKLFPDALISIALKDGNMIRGGAIAERDPDRAEAWRRTFPYPLTREYMHGTAMLDRRVMDIPDVEHVPAELAVGARNFLTSGYRAITIMPMLRGDEAIGALSVVRLAPGPLSDKQLAVQRTFAAQAVIAIENARLLNELRQRTDDLTESLEQQTATSEVLQVISSSPGAIEPVFQTILENATQLCGAKFGMLNLYDGDKFKNAALHNPPPGFRERMGETWRPHPKSGLARLAATRQIVHIDDIRIEPPYLEGDPAVVSLSDLAGARTLLLVPMLKDKEVIGAIGVYCQEVHPFTEKQIELVKNFAAQAVIAIENARLLSELRESLERQTATADVLKVISSSPGELEPVFNAMLANAVHICDATFGMLFRCEDGVVRADAMLGVPPAFAEFWNRGPQRPSHRTALGRTIETKHTVHIIDVTKETAYVEGESVFVAAVKLGGFRTILNVPMLKDNEVIGTLAIYRQEVSPFSDKQIELVQNFAAQAVIAIENTRLLGELRESLQQQTATADVLKVISRSTFDLQIVLDTLTESAARLCEADIAAIIRQKDAAYYWATSYGLTEELSKYVKSVRIEPGRGSVAGRVLQDRKTIHLPDVLADPEYTLHDTQKITGYRAMLGVPLLREGSPIGIVLMMRRTARPFSNGQIELAETFADQAVIAIENVRLFDEVQARTRELTQSVAELRALGEVSQAVNSTLDLETVLTTIVGKAVQLSRTDAGAIYVFDEPSKEFSLHATYGMSDTMIAAIGEQHIRLDDSNNITIATSHRKPVQVADARDEPQSAVNDIILREGYRSILVIPLLRPDQIIGALVVRRKTTGEFPQSSIALLQTFADQSTVAIENARLFENVGARTRELGKSLEELRATQDRLVQTEKLASLGQLTAGIAHEIKNPLNFVNNFSAISVELIDELREALTGANLDSKLRAQISETADMLQGNLAKVVQHGKRADSIVKNMLLHSRQGSQERRPVDINSVVEESLNLAFHGARAEKQGFNITLERLLDPNAGEVDVFPQEITRVLLNLISNGFYAATKRKEQGNNNSYEPTLATITRNLGDSVEIRIRDNGTGIPSGVKERMFDPFFTTKPAGEGTGLGLSISHDIIVKQHGGSIEVDTQPGEFTEFKIVLPRGLATVAKSGERT